MSTHSEEILGTVFQFLSKSDILTAHSSIPYIYLKFHYFDFLIDEKLSIFLKNTFNLNHLQYCRKNQNISFENLVLISVLAGDTNFVKKNLNKISQRYLYTIIECVCLGDQYSIVKMLLKYLNVFVTNEDILSNDSSDGITFLKHLIKMASENSKTYFLKLLLDVFQLNQECINYFFYCIEYGHFRAFKVFLDLIELGYIDLGSKTFDYILLDCIRGKKREMAKLIINHPKLKFVGSRSENIRGMELATKYGYTEIMKIFLQDGRVRRGKEDEIEPGDIKRFNITDGMEMCFHMACRKGKVRVVKVLLEFSNLMEVLSDIGISYKHIFCYTPTHDILKKEEIVLGLEDMVKGNQVEIIKLLLENGALCPKLNDCFLIRTAAELGYEEIVHIIHKDGRGVPKHTPPKSRLRRILNKTKYYKKQKTKFKF